VIAIFSDLHLDEKNFEENEKLLDWLLRQVNDCSELICLGDVFEKKDRIPNKIKNLFVDFVSNLHTNVRFYVLMGNHDYVDRNNPSLRFLNGFEGVLFVEDVLIEEERIFVPFMEESEFLKTLEKLPKKKYLFIHQFVKEIFPYGTDLELRHFFGFNRIFAGHYHTFARVKNYFKNCEFISVGMPLPRDFRDADENSKRKKRGIIKLKDLNSEIEFVEYKDFIRYVSIEADSEEDLMLHLDRIARWHEKTHLLVKVKRNFSKERIKKVCSNYDYVQTLSVKYVENMKTGKVQNNFEVFDVKEIDNILKDYLDEMGVSKKEYYFRTAKKLLEL